MIFGYDEQDLKVLLIDCSMPQYQDKLSLIGDLVNMDENLKDAAKRVMDEYTNLTEITLEQVFTFGKINRHPLGRVISTAYYTLVDMTNQKNLNLRKSHHWVNVKQLQGLAFDHDEILEKCIYKIRKSLREGPIGFNFLPEKFTLTKLQNLYEVILDIKLDKRNFRRKINKLDILIDTEMTQKEVSHRPAKLYRFDYESYNKRIMSGLNFEL